MRREDVHVGRTYAYSDISGWKPGSYSAGDRVRVLAMLAGGYDEALKITSAERRRRVYGGTPFHPALEGARYLVDKGRSNETYALVEHLQRQGDRVLLRFAPVSNLRMFWDEAVRIHKVRKAEMEKRAEEARLVAERRQRVVDRLAGEGIPVVQRPWISGLTSGGLVIQDEHLDRLMDLLTRGYVPGGSSVRTPTDKDGTTEEGRLALAKLRKAYEARDDRLRLEAARLAARKNKQSN